MTLQHGIGSGAAFRDCQSKSSDPGAQCCRPCRARTPLWPQCASFAGEPVEGPIEVSGSKPEGTLDLGALLGRAPGRADVRCQSPVRRFRTVSDAAALSIDPPVPTPGPLARFAPVDWPLEPPQPVELRCLYESEDADRLPRRLPPLPPPPPAPHPP